MNITQRNSRVVAALVAALVMVCAGSASAILIGADSALMNLPSAPDLKADGITGVLVCDASVPVENAGPDSTPSNFLKISTRDLPAGFYSPPPVSDAPNHLRKILRQLPSWLFMPGMLSLLAVGGYFAWKRLRTGLVIS